MKEQNVCISTGLPLINFYQGEIPKEEDWDTLVAEKDTQEIQENLDFLLARLEKENKRLMEDPKRVSFRCLNDQHLMQYYRDLIDLRIKDPLISSFPINKIISVDDITNLDFWIALIADYNTTATRSPHFLTKKIREGIPHVLRGLVWQSMSSAQDTYLEGLFEALCCEKSPYEKIITHDLPRTFPYIDMFKEENGDGQKKLQSVLRAFSLYDAEVGYCQGLGFIVGPLLMNMSEHEAFCVLVRLMECYDMRTMFTVNLSGLHLRLFQFEYFLSFCVPSVSTYFNSIGIHPFMYASQWFLSLFAVTCPLSILHRIYDIIFGEGAPETIIRVAIALIIKNEAHLLSIDFEENLQFLLSPELWTVYNQNDDELISDVVGLDNIVTKDSLSDLEQKFNQNIVDHKTFTKSTTSEIHTIAVRFFEKLWGNANASLPIFLSSSTSLNSHHECNDMQRISPKLNVSTSSSIDSESSEFETTNSRSSSLSFLDKKSTPKKILSFNNSFEHDNKKLHYQIEDLVIALNSLQKEHAFTIEQLEISNKASLKYKNIALRLVELMNVSLDFPDKGLSDAEESNKHDNNENVDNIVLDNVVSCENYTNENYDKKEIVQELLKELNDSCLPSNPLVEELSSLQEKLSYEQSKVKDLEKLIDLKELEIMDMKDQIRDVRIHWNEMLKEKQKMQKIISEIKYKKLIYVNNSQKDFLNSYDNIDRSLRELKLARQYQYGIYSPKNTNVSPQLQRTYNFLGIFTSPSSTSSSLSISDSSFTTSNICISCEQLREELAACKSKLAMYNQMSEEFQQKIKYPKESIFNKQYSKTPPIGLNIVSSTLGVSIDNVLNTKNCLFSGKWNRFKWS